MLVVGFTCHLRPLSVILQAVHKWKIQVDDVRALTLVFCGGTCMSFGDGVQGFDAILDATPQFDGCKPCLKSYRRTHLVDLARSWQ